jgi:RecJ-like exonuclease
MNKEITCEKCKGTGKIEVLVCDECGSDNNVGLDPVDNKHKCQSCWTSGLSEEEIRNLT